MTAELAPTPASPTVRPRRVLAELFLISFMILFFELACIRWFGSTVVFLTFFTNLVLMACFLGMTVGCLAASRRWSFLPTVLPLTLLAVLLSHAAYDIYTSDQRVSIDVGGQRSPQEVFFGTEFRAADPSSFIIPIEAIAGVFFVLIALMFLGLGQVMGRAFNAAPNRVAAYTANVLGSLAGIAAFMLASNFCLSPVVWFAIAASPCLLFARRQRAFPALLWFLGWAVLGSLAALAAYLLAAHFDQSPPVWFAIAASPFLLRARRQLAFQAAVLAALLGFLGWVVHVEDRGFLTTWSPYYKVQYHPPSRFIYVNNIMHQGMLQVDRAGPAYALPHLLNRDAGGRPFEDVLVIGAGSGNDVQAALLYGARHVDAVEIDPVIAAMGRAYHPGRPRPYRDPRVTVHSDDGRSFLRRTDWQYDLVTYALVDSLVLHSGYSSLRLESFLFTEQALRDIKEKLKPGGLFVMYNYYRQGWVVGRLQKLVAKVFGEGPVVISLPYQERITPAQAQGIHITFLLAGKTGASPVPSIRAAFRREGLFWVHASPALNQGVNGFSPTPPIVPGVDPGQWQKIGPAAVDTAGITALPSDDWPYLYLREPAIPDLSRRGMAMVAVLSLAILLLFAPVRRVRPNGQMFFLGAGFMLLETKAVVHMALLFGATWVVNSVVFFAILVMILLSNLFVLAVRPRRTWPYYGLLVGALLVGAVVPMDTFLALPGAAKVIASCAVVSVPVFFAGVVFAAAFRDSRQPDVDFGSNIGGVILGGLSEYFSVVVGFNHLLFVAVAFYLLSAVLRPRPPQ